MCIIWWNKYTNSKFLYPIQISPPVYHIPELVLERIVGTLWSRQSTTPRLEGSHLQGVMVVMVTYSVGNDGVMVTYSVGNNGVMVPYSVGNDGVMVT